MTQQLIKGWYNGNEFIGEDLDDLLYWCEDQDEVMRDFGEWCERTIDISQLVDNMFDFGVGSIEKEGMLGNYLYELDVDVGKDIEICGFNLVWEDEI